MKKLNNKAFTLIELLVVVLIIGILSAIALPQYEKAVLRARVSGAETWLSSARTASEAFLLNKNDADKYQATYNGDTQRMTVANGAGYLPASAVPIDLPYVKNFTCRISIPADGQYNNYCEAGQIGRFTLFSSRADGGRIACGNVTGEGSTGGLSGAVKTCVDAGFTRNEGSYYYRQ